MVNGGKEVGSGLDLFLVRIVNEGSYYATTNALVK